MLLERVKNNILRMTSTKVAAEISGHPQFMNIPPMLARAEAAHIVAVSLLDQAELINRKDTDRASVYHHAETLFAEAGTLFSEVSGCAAAAKWDVDFSPAIAFFNFLKQEMTMLAALAEGQSCTEETANRWPHLSGKLHEQNLFFSEAELKMLHLLKNTIMENERFFLKYRNFHKRMFTKQDADRYDHALQGFTQSYKGSL